MLKSMKEQLNHGFHDLKRCRPVWSDYNNTFGIFCRKPNDVAEVKVKCDQASSLLLANGVEVFIVCTG